MPIKYLQEVTDWSEADATIPNHTYIFDENKCIGYIRQSDGKRLMFSKPSRNFSKFKRKFKDVSKDYA